MKSILKRFKEVELASSSIQEKNDCVVRAVALTTDVSYQEAHGVCGVAGRKSRRGMFWSDTLTAAAILKHSFLDDSKRLKSIERRKGSRVTGKTITQWMPKRGRWVVKFHGHAAALVNGQLLDWTDGRKCHVIGLWKVERK